MRNKFPKHLILRFQFVSQNCSFIYCFKISKFKKKGRGNYSVTYFCCHSRGYFRSWRKPVIVNVGKCLNMNTGFRKCYHKKNKVYYTCSHVGNPARMDKIMKIAKKYKIPVIEDACQSIGARFKNKRVGTIGDFGTFSFDYGKNITAGEGGVIFSQNKIFLILLNLILTTDMLMIKISKRK